MRTFILKAKEDGRPTFRTDTQRRMWRQWWKDNAGKEVRVKVEKYSGAISREKRGYFEGALVPQFAEFCSIDEETAREILKQEFNGKWIKFNGERRKVARSTTKLDNDKMGEFINRIVMYFEENGIPVPDPEAYKAKRGERSIVFSMYDEFSGN